VVFLIGWPTSPNEIQPWEQHVSSIGGDYDVVVVPLVNYDKGSGQ
jgi:hypothetical protein